MFNPFAKIGEGVKYLAEHIWGGLKSVFGAHAKEIADAALNSAKTLLETEVGQFIKDVVTQLESSSQPGELRFQTAVNATTDYLKRQGTIMKTSWIQWAVQTVFLFVRGLSADALGAMGQQD